MNDVLYQDFEGLSMLFIHSKEEARQHNKYHYERCNRRSCTVFEQKEKRQSNKESRPKTNNLPFGKVERNLCLDFG